MKIRKYIIATSIIIVIVAIVALRLAANKNSFDQELKMVSESNTTILVITDTVKFNQQISGFTANGTFSPAQEISITAETQGKIVSISAETGNKVAKFQVLASIDNQVLASQLELAKFNLEKAEKDLKRYDQLSKSDAATTQQYESAKQEFLNAQSAYTTAKVDYENSYIKAPFNGIITKRYLDNGAYISQGSPVFDIVDINRLKFIAKLSAEEAENVQKNMKVKLNVDQYPGISYEGIVSAVIVKADLSKRYDVEIEVNNHADKSIKPGMYGIASFANNLNESKLIIPRRAIAGSIKNSEVFVVKDDSVVLQKIIVAPLNDKYVTVNEGLKVGDIIVTSGQISLVNGSKIKLNK